MMVEQEGTLHSSSDLLNMMVKIGASWLALILSQEGETLFKE